MRKKEELTEALREVNYKAQAIKDALEALEFSERIAGSLDEDRKAKPVPRRVDMTRWTGAEKAIADARDIVEEAGCHPFLTDASVLLEGAQTKVADFVDLPKSTEDIWQEAIARARVVYDDGEVANPEEVIDYIVTEANALTP